jgi:hypothetical protein
LGVVLLAGAGRAGQDRARAPALVIDYPLGGSICPPDFAPPMFLRRDATQEAVEWSIDVEFADGTPARPVDGRPTLIATPALTAEQRR